MLSIYKEKNHKETPVAFFRPGFLAIDELLCVEIASRTGKPFLGRHVPPNPKDN